MGSIGSSPMYILTPEIKSDSDPNAYQQQNDFNPNQQNFNQNYNQQSMGGYNPNPSMGGYDNQGIVTAPPPPSGGTNV